MLLAQNLLNPTHTQTFASVGGGPSVWVVAPTLWYVCVCTYVCWLLPACLLPLCNWGKQSFPSPVKPHAGLPFAQSSLTAGCRRGVWWSGSGLIRQQTPSLFYLSVAHTPASICLSIHAPDPQAAQHKHLLPLPLFMPEVPSTGWCVFVPALITSLLIRSPQQWPLPSTVHVCLCFVSFGLKWFYKPLWFFILFF